MRSVSELTIEQLRHAVSEIQQILWLEGTEWMADKEWSTESIEMVADVLGELGLRPPETEVTDDDIEDCDDDDPDWGRPGLF